MGVSAQEGDRRETRTDNYYIVNEGTKSNPS